MREPKPKTVSFCTIAGTLASVLVYITVLILYFIRRGSITEASSGSATQLAQQKRMLLSLGAISTMTFVLVVVPMSVSHNKCFFFQHERGLDGVVSGAVRRPLA